MLENDTQFSSKKSAKVRNTTGTKFFWNIKISWKIMNFVYQNLHSTKKFMKKRLFPNHPYVIRHWFYGFLKKIDFFLKFFVQIYTLKKKRFSFVVFWLFFDCVWKMCYQSKEKYFLFSFSKKNFKLNTRMRGGRKVHFSKSTFWITSRETKSPLFSQSLSSFKG